MRVLERDSYCYGYTTDRRLHNCTVAKVHNQKTLRSQQMPNSKVIANRLPLDMSPSNYQKATANLGVGIIFSLGVNTGRFTAVT